VNESPSVYRAKLALGFGDIDGFAKPCEVPGCRSRLSRTYSGKTQCWDHYTGPLQIELPAGRHLVRNGSDT